MTGLTLERIAELSGVSRSTVSRVINGHKRVSAEVRACVLQVIADTGYQPDPAAQLLASRRTFPAREHPGPAAAPRRDLPQDPDHAD
jgi:transcriptional regulator with XRE-family HTH domain